MIPRYVVLPTFIREILEIMTPLNMMTIPSNYCNGNAYDIK